jgi:hypothetical protein
MLVVSKENHSVYLLGTALAALTEHGTEMKKVVEMGEQGVAMLAAMWES